MILEEADKRIFIQWLEAEILSADRRSAAGMLEVTDDLPQWRAIREKFKAESLACKVVRKMLMSGETMTII